jgi:hypothetical protein
MVFVVDSILGLGGTRARLMPGLVDLFFFVGSYLREET